MISSITKHTPLPVVALGTGATSIIIIAAIVGVATGFFALLGHYQFLNIGYLGHLGCSISWSVVGISLALIIPLMTIEGFCIYLLIQISKLRQSTDSSPPDETISKNVTSSSSTEQNTSINPPYIDKLYKLGVIDTSHTYEQKKLEETLINTHKKCLEITKPECSIAQQESFQSKNRHAIFPYDINRYQMQDAQLQQQTPYINASTMISGDILTQGPLQNSKQSTIYDFWNMCWDSQASIIVNCTECTGPRGSIVCAEYWPTYEPLSLSEDFKITFLEEQTFLEKENNPVDIRKFKLTKGNNEKIVTQIHIRYWKDGSTAHIDAIAHAIDQIEHLRAHDDTAPLPFIAHCSAGIGRAGAFYACFLLHEIKKYNPNIKKEHIHIEKLIEVLRLPPYGRSFTIQGMEQGEFLYQYLDKLFE